MININKYNSLEDYMADANITIDECRVSQIGESSEMHIMYDIPTALSENRVLNASQLGKDDVCVVVKDNLTGKIKYIPQAYFNASTLDISLYEIKPYVRFRGEGRNQYMMHKSATSGKWARNNYYKLTISGLTNSTDTVDSSLVGQTLTLTVKINDTDRTATTTIQSSDTLATISTRLNTAISGGKMTSKDGESGFYIGYVGTEGFIRCADGSYNNTTMTVTEGSSFATLDDLSKKLRYNGTVPTDYTTETHHSWGGQYIQSMLPSSIVTDLRNAYNGETDLYRQTAYCRHGEALGYRSGGNYYRYYTYYNGTNGAQTTASPFGSNTAPLSSATFDSWTQTEFATYKDYLIARMYDVDNYTANGVNYLSHDNGQQVSSILANIETQDFDGTWVSAFPAAYNAVQYTDPDLGTCGLPTAHEIGLFMCDERPNRFGAINSAITALTGGNLLSDGTYYWSSVEYGSSNAWLYHGGGGTLSYINKCNTFTVRPALVYAV